MFQFGALAGFSLLGIFAFKVRTRGISFLLYVQRLSSQMSQEQMNAQAGLWTFIFEQLMLSLSVVVAIFLPT